MEDPNIIYGGDIDDSDLQNYASLGDLIIENLRKKLQKENLIDGITGKISSNKEILDISIKVSEALKTIGVNEFDTIATVTENRHEFIPIAFGTFFINSTLSPINCSYTKGELRHALELTRPKVIFTSTLAVSNVIAACKDLPFVEHVILIDNQGEKLDGTSMNFKDFLDKSSLSSLDIYQYVKKKVITDDKTALLFLSSGTTGKPKGVEITQLNIMSIVQRSFDNVDKFKEKYGRLVTLVVAPWFHVLGFVHVLMSLIVGESVNVYMAKFDPDLYLRNIETYKITSIITAPPIVVFLAKTPLFNKYNLSSLQGIHCGAAPLSRETELEVKKRFNRKVSIHQGYGMSETTYGIISSIDELKPGSIGKIIAGCYVKVIDKNGKSLGPNKPGELCFKGPLIMKGYLNDPKSTAETIDNDGWLHSGDVGYYNEDQEFFIVDRLKELIKYKAFQVAPAELEGLLLSHPKIKDAGVIGIPDEIAGELPMAYVVKQPGAELTEKKVKDFVAKNVSNAKWLRGGVKFIDEIPKNPSGKILRRKLKEMYTNTRAKL